MRKFLDFMGLEGLTKEELIDGLLASLVVSGMAVVLLAIGVVLEVML